MILHRDRVRAPPLTQIAYILRLGFDQISGIRRQCWLVGYLYGALRFVLTSESYDVSQAADASSSGGDRLHILINPIRRSSILEQQRIASSNNKTRSLHNTTAAMRFHNQPLYAQTLRYYAQSTRATKADRLGAAVTAGYCCLAFSAPFAGAALVSKNAKKDDRYANLYVSRLTSSCRHPD